MCALAALAVGHATAAQPAADPGPTRSPSVEAPSVGVALLAGVLDPLDHQVAAGPSLRALVLYQPLRALAFGASGQIARHHFRADYVAWGTPGSVEADLTTGFAGVAGRWTTVPDWVVSPLVELDLGVAMQTQSGSGIHCPYGASPGARLGLGVRARVARSWSLFATGSALGGISSQCSVADGPPAAPFAAWGYGLQVGAGFDLGLGAGPARNLAAR